MKKSLVSIFAGLTLMLALLPAAWADTTFAVAEDVPAGSEMDLLVARVSAEKTVSAEENTLPEGVALGTEDVIQEELVQQNVYLRGTPVCVGEYLCLINFSGESESSLVVPLSVVPAAPVVTTGPQVTCTVGADAQVSVQASANDGGILSYQWYSNTSPNNTNGTAIEGADQPVLKVSTAAAGTMYYYCKVTNTNGGMTSDATSDIVTVTVEEVSIRSVSVETLPAKTTYVPGDELDTSGLSLRVNYTNNSSLVVNDGFTCTPMELGPEGSQTITVNYSGFTCTFQVTVSAPQEVIEGIGVLSMPNKRDYSVGDTFDPTGLTIMVYTNLGQREVGASELSFSPMVFDKAGSQDITISYGGKTCKYTLQISEAEKNDRIILKNTPSKLQYTIGDTLDTAGLVISVVTTKGNIQDVYSGFTCTPTLLNTVGTMPITVSYEGFTCTFNVTVSSPEFATPTPSARPTLPPVQSSAPVVPSVPVNTFYVSPTPSSHVIEHQSHDSGGLSTLLVVLMVAALVGLAGVGGYVYVVNRGGIDQVKADILDLIERIKERFGRK